LDAPERPEPLLKLLNFWEIFAKTSASSKITILIKMQVFNKSNLDLKKKLNSELL
jgi:hypothetical protein